MRPVRNGRGGAPDLATGSRAMARPIGSPNVNANCLVCPAMTDQTLRAAAPSGIAGRVMMPWLVAVAVYLTLLPLGGQLLNDPDSYAHLVIGRWIIENRTFPR